MKGTMVLWYAYRDWDAIGSTGSGMNRFRSFDARDGPRAIYPAEQQRCQKGKSSRSGSTIGQVANAAPVDVALSGAIVGREAAD